MKICDRIQQTIAEEGLESVERDTVARGHLQSCPQCARFLKAFTELQSGIERLPEHDAPDALVEQTLQAVAAAGEPGQTPVRTATDRSPWAPALAGAAVIVATLGLTYHFVMPFDRVITSDVPAFSQTARGFGSYRTEKADNGPRPVFATVGDELEHLVLEPTAPPASSTETAVSSTPQRELNKDLAKLQTTDQEFPEEESARTSKSVDYQLMPEGNRIVATGNIVAQLEPDVSGQESKRKYKELPAQNRREGFADKKRGAQHGEFFAKNEAPQEPDPRNQLGADLGADGESGARLPLEDGRLDLSLLVQSGTPTRDDGLLSEQNEQHRSLSQPQPSDTPAVEKPNFGESSGDDAIAVLDTVADLDLRLEITTEPEPAVRTGKKSAAESLQVAGIATPAASSPAKQFLAELERREGLTFQPVTGYWANTYVPGDPAMRLLQARLASWDRGALNLDKAAQPIRQPFDIPRNAALAVHLQADKRAVAGPSRLRVQIGLQTSRRRSGQRPAVNVGVVLDLRGASGERFAHEFRALLMALAKARQPGDRFALTVAGVPGGLVLEPDEFRHGPLTVAMRKLFADDAPGQAAAALDLTQAMALAARALQRQADAEATLGASQVLLVSGASIANELPELQALAHANAIKGIPLSVISAGGDIDLDNIDRLVLAGQGSRRILTSAAQADIVIDKELYSTSRVVARAVRLRIRLAPGVKLVEVLGSRRLSDPQAQRVREAEQGIDRRLSRNLGIQADRGEDEEGIQIVIPAMEANTSHVVLLDVLTDRPGPIADVTVRYKDLVYLRNGVARAQLTIDQGTQAPGPLERNVLKNLMALELANTARRASQLLAQGNPAAAASTLNTARELLAGLRNEIGEWKTDKELVADETMLAEYISLLQSQAVADAQQRRYLMDSLHLSAFRKLLPMDLTSAAAGE